MMARLKEPLMPLVQVMCVLKCIESALINSGEGHRKDLLVCSEAVVLAALLHYQTNSFHD